MILPYCYAQASGQRKDQDFFANELFLERFAPGFGKDGFVHRHRLVHSCGWDSADGDPQVLDDEVAREDVLMQFCE